MVPYAILIIPCNTGNPENNPVIICNSVINLNIYILKGCAGAQLPEVVCSHSVVWDTSEVLVTDACCVRHAIRRGGICPLLSALASILLMSWPGVFLCMQTNIYTVPEVEHQPKRDSWSLSLVFVYIMPYPLQVRSGRARSTQHGIRSLVFVATSAVALRVMEMKKRDFGMVPEK